MCADQPPPFPEPRVETLAMSVRRDLEVGRYDHVPQRAVWLQAIALEAAQVAGASAASINLMKSTTQRTVAAVGADVTLSSRRDSMCAAIIDDGRTVHVSDVSLDSRWMNNPFVNGRWGNVRFYGAHPLINPAGFVIGTLCVRDEHPRELTPCQVQTLDALARRVVAELEDSRLAALKAGINGCF